MVNDTTWHTLLTTWCPHFFGLYLDGNLVATLPPAGRADLHNRNHLHLGAAQTEARIQLPPGQHTIQLVLGDHVPFEPSVSYDRIIAR